jgi:hypothetical protein
MNAGRVIAGSRGFDEILVFGNEKSEHWNWVLERPISGELQLDCNDPPILVIVPLSAFALQANP